MLKQFLMAIVIVLVLFFSFSWYESRPVFDGDETASLSAITVASKEQALTLARNTQGDIYLITSADQQYVRGINVSDVTQQTYQDAFQAFKQLGHAALFDLYGHHKPDVLSWEQLREPVLGRHTHIAAGTNYRAHAEEVGLDGTPFLFPKIVKPTSWNASVLSAARLDHEVELCAIPLNDYQIDDELKLAYVLCTDFTDRWQLVRHLDRALPMGLTGFIEGKSQESYLPTGPFLLIPNTDTLINEIELNLYVNRAQRQHARADQMVWPVKQILNESLKLCQSDFKTEEDTLHLTENCQSITSGTLVLTGTPEGVMFNLYTLWNPYFYLQPDDVVTSYATYLGKTRSVIK